MTNGISRPVQGDLLSSQTNHTTSSIPYLTFTLYQALSTLIKYHDNPHPDTGDWCWSMTLEYVNGFRNSPDKVKHLRSLGISIEARSDFYVLQDWGYAKKFNLYRLAPDIVPHARVVLEANRDDFEHSLEEKQKKGGLVLDALTGTRVVEIGV